MKTLVKTIACAFALSSTVAFASGGETTTAPKTTKFEVGAYVAKDESIRVAIKKYAAETVRISLRNAIGDELYTETMGKKEKDFAKKLNVHDLGDGSYKLVVTAGNETYSKDLKISTKAIETERKVALQ